MARPALGKAAGLLSYFVRHRTAANLLLVVLIALGFFAAPNMRAQFFPDVVVDNVTVSVTWEGAGAEDVDRGIVELMEPTLLAVEGVAESTSRSSEGRASMTLEFEPGWDMGRAADDVQSAVDTITSLPEDAEEPAVRRGVWRDRVTDVVITGPVGVEQLARYTDEFVLRLFQEGVTRTTIRGIAAPRTTVEVTSLALVQHDVSMADIAATIAEATETNPAGDVSGSSRVRTGSERRSASDIAAVVLRSNPDGSQLTIGDIATVRVDGVDRERAYFVGDNPAMSIRVDRSAQGDAIEIQRQVEEVAADMQATLPDGTAIDLIRTRAELITARLDILLDNGLLGLGLVVLLLFLFLNARTAFWVAAGVPVAMTAAIAMMFAAGLTINMISLFALIITLGIVVDDAIVVGEHADFRNRRLGEDPVTAAENAAKRMFTPVFAATVTTVIAFFGLTAIGGRFGDLIADIPFTVIVVLIASLVECFLILPNHMAHALTHSAKDHWYDWPSRQVNKGFRWFREVIFRRLMAGVIWARYPVIAGVLLILASQVTLFIRGDVPWRFFNSPEQGSVTANFAMLPGATREDTLEMIGNLQDTVERVAAEYEAEHGLNPVTYALAEIGGFTGRGLSGGDTKDTDQIGSIAIELIDADLRPYTSFAFVGDLQDNLTRHPLLETVSFRRWGSGPGGDSLDVQISGASTETLKAAAEALKTEVEQFGEVSAVEDTLAYDKEELSLNLTPQGQALGFTTEGLGRVLRNRLGGIEAATFPDGPRSAEIRVELPDGEMTADFLDRAQMRTPEGVYVPLADIVTVESRTGFSTIRRENGIRVVSVTGTISEDDPARAVEVTDAIQNRILPELEERFGVATELGGLAEQENAFLQDALTGLILCLTGIFLTLAWVFSSWTRPIVVMAIVPFGLVGTIYGHHLWDVPLSMFSIVGMIGMTGIIINDSIVLVKTIDEYAEDRGMLPAIIDGAADRLRPVMLTTLTTVLGLAPLLYEGSQQAQFLKPTVITLVYGLGFGLVLVLLVVPSLLAMQHDVARQIRSAQRAMGATARSPLAAWATRAAAGAAAVLFVLIVLPVATDGSVPAPLSGLLPDSVTQSTGVAVALFAVLLGIILTMIWAVVAGLRLRRQV